MPRTTYPEALAPPPKLNPHAIELWFEACKDLPKEPKLAWKQVLEKYNEACHSAGFFPFSDPDHCGNWAISTYLYKRRRKFVRMLDYTGFMVGLPVIRLIKKHATPLPEGFRLTVSCQLQIDDPTWVKKLFTLPGGYRFPMQRDRLRRYIKKLDPGIEVFVYNDLINAPNRWHIGYTITCPFTPDYENMEHEKEYFIMRFLWGPLWSKFRGRKLDPIRYI